MSSVTVAVDYLFDEAFWLHVALAPRAGGGSAGEAKPIVTASLATVAATGKLHVQRRRRSQTALSRSFGVLPATGDEIFLAVLIMSGG
ncbi:hypothetical protein GGTG_13322 [Gaeumannomyces tritici R3-111a-1]|uniref:Uncharacterized protein n=1 Tax=Gaeumannomyces tritici (strain R3-111a-1) TaxID=644352 RepID=J3PIJ3_GAET3|nr:hypothetical protein GGTG_13322 [Gaeumannomyces tritici R3-111a-1]EJT69213.1 hypothetical protein GGTG_13322 [Gaeumannomyces tritici R3-111a-1]